MKQIISVVLLVILVGGLASFATYEYHNRPQPKQLATVSQKQYNQVVSNLQAHDAVATVKEKQLTDQITAGDAKLASTCGQLKVLKQTNVNCQ